MTIHWLSTIPSVEPRNAIGADFVALESLDILALGLRLRLISDFVPVHLRH